ncbi:LysR family transcriptional regulator [Neokomagataea tanensis]|uniref:LysR family transcriptional regulator n=2 Tax=Neokomagataea TaxID=1223423 RepID=A0A4Y6V406_9PROT|nr:MULTISPECIES: LysR substrate-binding domain-containing protein [Neokomagataea]QDH24852.1 LysR family transcriptional regulator [Neokomagataea tanensis]
MQYVQLRAVHAVALHGGFSAAAEALGVTQPAISDQVRKLEQEYGCVLFHRRGRLVEPTELGRRLLTVLQPMFDAHKQAERLLTQAENIEYGSLSIVADAPDLAVGLIASFRALHPNVQVTLSIANADTCLERIANATVDLAVTAAPSVDSRLHAQILRRDRLMALVQKRSPLGEKKKISLGVLAASGLIFREARSVTQRLLETELQQHQILCEPALVVDGREAMVEAVAAGLGVGVIAASEYGGRRGVRAIPVSDCHAKMTVSLVSLKQQANTRLVSEIFKIAALDSAG